MKRQRAQCPQGALRWAWSWLQAQGIFALNRRQIERMLLLSVRIFRGTENTKVVFKMFLNAACFRSQQLVFVIFLFSFSSKFFRFLFLFFIPIDVFSFLQDSSLNENHQFTDPTFATSWPPILVMCGTDFDARWVPAQLRNGFVWPLWGIPRGVGSSTSAKYYGKWAARCRARRGERWAVIWTRFQTNSIF